MKIKNTSEITIEELLKFKKETELGEYVRVEDKQANSEPSEYLIYEMIKIKGKILEYIKDVPQIPAEDKDREKKIFTYLYIKMAISISYDEKAAKCCKFTGYFEGMISDYVKSASNLKRLIK